MRMSKSCRKVRFEDSSVLNCRNSLSKLELSIILIFSPSRLLYSQIYSTLIKFYKFRFILFTHSVYLSKFIYSEVRLRYIYIIYVKKLCCFLILSITFVIRNIFFLFTWQYLDPYHTLTYNMWSGYVLQSFLYIIFRDNLTDLHNVFFWNKFNEKPHKILFTKFHYPTLTVPRVRGNRKSGEDFTFGKARRCRDDIRHPITSLLVILVWSLSRSTTQKMRRKKEEETEEAGVRTGPKATGIPRGAKITGDSRLRQWRAAFAPASELCARW